jgi:hypothetical protein
VNKNKKVLIVEKDDLMKGLVHSNIKRAGKQADIFFAHTSAQAERIIAENPDISVVSICGRFSNNYHRSMASTVTLIPIIREKLKGAYVIASSSDPVFADQLLKAGCDVIVEKINLPKHLAMVI